MDPDIRLQKSEALTLDCHADPTTHHDRPVDVGIGIQVIMPCYRAGSDVEYYGEYLGHGHAKTAFELQCPGERFHGTVLKVTKNDDLEPEVFREANKHGLTTRILYECHGMDRGVRYHCWITERTIPLDEFCRHDGVDKERCSMAAFYCMLQAASYGINLSDCHFFNFGVRLTDTATEHVVVIIDAGSRGMQPGEQWKKSHLNMTVVSRFWKACAKESAENAEIQDKWRQCHSTLEYTKWIRRKWQDLPILTTTPMTTNECWQAMIANEKFRRSEAQSTSAYKIMEMVGRFACVDEWNGAFAIACYRAAQAMNAALLPEESEILSELYSRITATRPRECELHQVMAFWARLQEYREHHCQYMPRSRGDQTLKRPEARKIWQDFIYYELWHDLSWQQQQSNRWKSTVNTVLQKKAAWTFAAKAIIEYGFPKLQHADASHDATEHINSLGKFAVDLTAWLRRFASGLNEYKQTERYQQERAASLGALKRRKTGANK